MKFTETINKNLFSFPCIYLIKNIINDKLYVGQAQNLCFRFREYRRAKPRASKHLLRSFLKYGINNFEVTILEKVEIARLNEREQFWMDFYQSYRHDIGYNICKEAGTTRGRKRPEKECKKISKLAKLRVGNKNPFYGRKHTQETKDKIGKANQKKKRSAEHIKAFCGSGQEARKKKIIQIDKNTNKIIKIWDYIKQASDELKISDATIIGVARKYPHKKTAGGFKWEYV